MLLTFNKPDSTATTLGVFKALRFDGEVLRESRDGPPLARHRGHRWQVRGEDYLRLDCEGPLVVTFLDGPRDKSKTFGPYAHFSSVDGIAYADHHVFCDLDTQTQKWFLRVEQTEWASLLLKDSA
jgi:hypothetical protein